MSRHETGSTVCTKDRLMDERLPLFFCTVFLLFHFFILLPYSYFQIDSLFFFNHTLFFPFFSISCILKDNIVTRSSIRVRYHNRLLSFHLIDQIPMKSIFHRQCRWALEYMYTSIFKIKKNNGHIIFQ